MHPRDHSDRMMAYRTRCVIEAAAISISPRMSCADTVKANGWIAAAILPQEEVGELSSAYVIRMGSGVTSSA